MPSICFELVLNKYNMTYIGVAEGLANTKSM